MIVLGRITAPFGVRGWVKVHPFGDDPLAWGTMPQWWLGVEPDWRTFDLQECAAHGSGVVAHFAGIEDRTAAEKLCGLFVAAPREALPANAGGEYYWADLIGLEVVNLVGERLGKVTDLVSTGAHEVLRVGGENGGQDKQHLLPFVAEVVRDVDLAAGTIRVDWQRDW